MLVDFQAFQPKYYFFSINGFTQFFQVGNNFCICVTRGDLEKEDAEVETISNYKYKCPRCDFLPCLLTTNFLGHLEIHLRQLWNEVEVRHFDSLKKFPCSCWCCWLHLNSIHFIYESAAPGGLKDSKCFSRPERDEEAVKKRKQEKKKISAEAKASFCILISKAKKKEMNSFVYLFWYIPYTLNPIFLMNIYIKGEEERDEEEDEAEAEGAGGQASFNSWPFFIEYKFHFIFRQEKMKRRKQNHRASMASQTEEE